MLVSGGGLLFSLCILLWWVQSFSFYLDSCIFITLSITTVWDIWKHFLSFFFSPLVAINYFNNDYLAASQGASAWQLLIRLPTTTRADWLMSLLRCRWPPAAGPTASPAWRQTRRQRPQLPQLLCPEHLHSLPCTQCKSSAAWQLSGNALVPSKPTSRVAPARQNALGERHGHMEISDEDQRQFQVIA